MEATARQSEMGAWEPWRALPFDPSDPPPKVAIWVDGRPVYGGLAVPDPKALRRHAERYGGPATLEALWASWVARLEAKYPKAQRVAVEAVYSGNPPRRIPLTPKDQAPGALAEVLAEILDMFPEDPPF